MKFEWRDGTSYSRDRPRVQSVWKTKIGPVRACIVRGHIYHKNEWVGHAFPIFETKPLTAPLDDVEAAKRELIGLIVEWAARLNTALTE